MAKNTKCATILLFAFGITGLIEGMASENVQVLVNDSAVISCFPDRVLSVQWHHTPPGKYSNAYVYAGGRFYSPYKTDRFRAYNDPTTNIYTLFIANVTHEDAGFYECKDDVLSGVFGSTQLIVLNSGPICNSNMYPGGFIGPNECNLQQEIMTFSCAVSFAGKTPSLVWRSFNDNQSFINSTCTRQSNHIDCSITLKADPAYDGSVFICETKESNGARLNCSTEFIKVQYFSADSETSARKVHDNVSCIANSNLEPRYSWKKLEQNGQYVFLSSKRTIVLKEPGIYRCDVEYSIRNNNCSFLTSVVNVSVDTSSTDSPKEQGIGLAIALPIGLLVGIVAAVIIYRKCINDGKETMPEPSASVMTTTKMSSEKAISGMAIVKQELFFTYFQSPEIKTYDLISLAFVRSIPIVDLVNAYDMKHCVTNQCLYIMDATYANKHKSILKLTLFGELASWISWKTKSGYGCISVTYDHNVLLAAMEESRIEEYSPDGTLIREIELAPEAMVSYLHYAIKLPKDRFLISQGEGDDQLHRVCVIDAEGNIRLASGGRHGRATNRFNVPIYLTIDSRGSIVVIDRDNSRVLSLEPNWLDFRQEVIESGRDGMIRPERMVLDEDRGKIFIAHNDVDWKECCVFVFDYNNRAVPSNSSNAITLL